jgi:hypothetical protein
MERRGTPYTFPRWMTNINRIFRLCDDLQRAMLAGAATAEVQSIVDGLVIHTAQHFSHEEREMRAARLFPLYAWHRRPAPYRAFAGAKRSNGASAAAIVTRP